MPRIARNKVTKRLNLEMSEQVRKRLERLRDETDADSLAEVFRTAIAVYDFVWDQKRQGHQIFTRTPTGDQEIHLL